MSDLDREAFEVCRTYRAEILFAASKRYRALRGAMSHAELLALAQQCMCVMAGLMPGTPSFHGELDRIKAKAPKGEIDRWVQHALDWYLAIASRNALHADHRQRGGTIGAGDVVTRQAPVSLDAILNDDGNPHADRLLAVKDADPMFWDGCSDLFTRYYLDGYTSAELAASHGTTRSVINKRMAAERREFRKLYLNRWEAA